jgi:hypothetical protein
MLEGWLTKALNCKVAQGDKTTNLQGTIDMRVFDHFAPAFGALCPVCKTAADKPTVLVPIPETEDDGICQARQVHKQCYDLVAEMSAASPSNAEITGCR